jgi:hypothetical protein
VALHPPGILIAEAICSAPSKRREKLNQVAKSARRLLDSLGIDDFDEAADGPGDPEIFKALMLTGEPDENPVVEATRRKRGNTK